MEFLIAVVVVLLAALGLSAGLILTGRPPQNSCGGLACAGGGRCDGCPRLGSGGVEDHDA
ncbi:hypothetical protein [Sinisalibacter aestuarii]|uniref:(Na+)-NQR maturation NqrM n=1 Tax=Sinisalibacter aestuarii TaxID=2949426 RepID=A0ABQ5LYT5_9RHOB|nr:hypothetical protein [Sinisalibacter aestuarii]GKY90143.1 hypothetical protein STA1M1_40120 [Sinisalibacter aestuarii]